MGLPPRTPQGDASLLSRMNDALERLGDARPMGRDETIQREPSSQQQRAEEARLCNSSQWERTEGNSQTTAHANCSSGRSSEAERTQLPQRKKRVSWAIDESLQTVVFLPPTARALILRALEMVNIWVDDTEERCSGGGLSVRAFFQASLLRLQAWATGELDALRPEYTNRHGKPVSYQQEYAQAWSALAELYKGNAAKLFAAATDGDRGVKLLSVSAITLPCVHTALEHTQGGGECGAEGERVLVDALAALRDDAGLAATATEQEGSAKHAQVPAEAEEKVGGQCCTK